MLLLITARLPSELSLPHALLPNNSARNRNCTGFCNARHSFCSPNMLVFYNHCIGGFLMIARSMRVISNMHHSGATHSWAGYKLMRGLPSSVMLYRPILLLKCCKTAITQKQWCRVESKICALPFNVAVSFESSLAF